MWGEVPCKHNYEATASDNIATAYTEDVEGGEDDQGQEEGVVVEDGESSSFILSNLQQIE